MGSDDDCLSVTGRVILGILNTLVMVIGFILLVFGILAAAYIPAINFLLESSSGQYAALTLTEGTGFPVENLADLIKAAAYALIIFGVFFFVIGLLGLIGGCCKVNCALIPYVVLMILLILAQIAFLIIVFSQRDVLDGSVKQPLLDMTMKYKQYDAKDSDTVTMNFLMVSLKCCGVNDYTDFKKIKDGGSWNNNATGVPLETPLFCCVVIPTTPKPSETTCATTAEFKDKDKNNSNRGCYDALWSSVDEEQPLVIGICSAIIILQVILVVFAIYIVCRNAKNDSADFQ
ncbi:hypothetical protein SNE40_023226 [Patella caerulea]|uniref:Tetraspanin n=1 Tax=Patella caerulea TaxID=87958 RepID=A0AAN8GG89_PATCE